MSTVVVTVSDGIIKKKREDNTNSNSYYSHNDYDRYSNKEKDYSPDLENDDDDMVKKQLLLLLLIAATTLLLLLKNKKNNHLFTIKEFFL